MAIMDDHDEFGRKLEIHEEAPFEKKKTPFRRSPPPPVTWGCPMGSFRPDGTSRNSGFVRLSGVGFRRRKSCERWQRTATSHASFAENRIERKIICSVFAVFRARRSITTENEKRRHKNDTFGERHRAAFDPFNWSHGRLLFEVGMSWLGRCPGQNYFTSRRSGALCGAEASSRR